MRRKEKNRWISVEEQLPEDDVLVLVTVSGIYNALTFANAIQIGAYDRDRWFIEGYEDWNNPNVTVWMPLPEPYIPALEQDKPSGWQGQMIGAFWVTAGYEYSQERSTGSSTRMQKLQMQAAGIMVDASGVSVTELIKTTKKETRRNSNLKSI